MKNQWWVYIHENGSLQVKRFFDLLDIKEAQESPFVDAVYGPFEADTREDALDILKKMK